MECVDAVGERVAVRGMEDQRELRERLRRRSFEHAEAQARAGIRFQGTPKGLADERLEVRGVGAIETETGRERHRIDPGSGDRHAEESQEGSARDEHVSLKLRNSRHRADEY